MMTPAPVIVQGSRRAQSQRVSSAGSLVMLVLLLPSSAFMVKTSLGNCRDQAIFWPSGDHTGKASNSPSLVRRTAPEPSTELAR